VSEQISIKGCAVEDIRLMPCNKPTPVTTAPAVSSV
jgi:hypothetical protein